MTNISEPLNFQAICWYAKRAKLAYEPEEVVRQQLPSVIEVVLLADINVQYFIELVSEEGAQLVSVRGTANLANAKEDADFVKAKDKRLDIYLHKGFERDANIIYETLKSRLDKSLPVILTGHSLGAAISTVLMMYLHHDGYELRPSINFGQPKATNKEGVAKYSFLPLLRVVDDKDLVPLVPPENLLDVRHGVYEHLGQELILLKEEFYVLLNEKRAEKESVGVFWKNLGYEDIPDHYMDNYLSRIAEKIDQSKAVDYKERHKYS